MNDLYGQEALEAETLGTLLLDPTLVPEFLQTAPIEIFTHPWHQTLYKMAQKLHERSLPFTITNIATVFSKHLERVGGTMYLGKVASSAISGATMQNNILRLNELASCRKAKELLRSYWEKFDDPSTGQFEELLDQFEQEALAIRPPSQKSEGNINALIGWYEELAEKAADPSKAFGILTGWEALDRLTLGFQRTDFTIVGARTSMGKTAFANEIVMRAMKRGFKVAVFSLEMTASQLYSRMTSNMCGIPMQNMRTGRLSEGDLAQISACLDDLRRIHLDDSRGVTAEYICSEMRRLKRQHGLDLVLVDYIQEVIEPGEKTDHGGSAAQRISQKLRKAASDCDCAVIGLSQVKQEVEARANKRPFVSDLFGGAALAAIADNVILLYRDEYYNPDTADRDVLEVNLAKQRNGPVGTVKLHYDKDYQRIGSITNKYEGQRNVPDMYRRETGA